ncbi:MAG: retroviral-like aspartic protease family protein [Anaerolineae bacterium]
MHSFPYDATYEPPLPIAEVELKATAGARTVSLTAIIDTGADATIVPTAWLEQINARPVLEAHLRSQWGERRQVFLYLVDVTIASIVLSGMSVVGDNLGDEVVLGRDVLNRLRLQLDGPAKVTRLLG